jgi:hypothetical protein
MAFAVALALLAPWAFFAPLLLGRDLSAEELAQMARLIAAA